MFLVLCVLVMLPNCGRGLSIRNDPTVVDPKGHSSVDDCDPSTVPVMESFDIKKFSGKWFELAKTTAGYIDVSDGVWKIEGNNDTYGFLFSGRDNNQHCIRPIRGKISAENELSGLLTLKYQTYSTYVKEDIRVLFTDYTSVAVVYACMHHLHHHGGGEACHVAGVLGSVWTRAPHVDVDVYEKALRFLEKACVHRTALHIRNVVGPCRVDDLEFRVDDFPAPDYCYQPVDVGSCRGSVERYHYDAKENACKTFMYGGCGGNKNNFMSNTECQQKCLTSSVKDPVCMSTAKCGLHCSPCCAEDENGCVECNCERIIEDDFLNCMKSTTVCPDECEVIHFYTGCNVCKCDIEQTTIDTQPTSICHEKIAAGNCNDNVERFYFDTISEQCKPFQYSGCNGNNNNFLTYNKCKEECQVSGPFIVQMGPVQENNSAIANQCNIWIFISFIITLLRIRCICQHFH